MREIKFRMWSIKLSHMYYDQDNKKEPYLWDMKNNVTGGKIENNIDNILMQYTGLRDKYDVEIYEGDIVKSDRKKRWQKKEGKSYIGSVHFNKKELRFEAEPFLPMSWSGYESVEIIGNKYENPELLKD